MGFGPISGGGTITPTKVTITFQDFIDAVVPGTFPIATSAGAVIQICKVKHSIAFAAPTLINANINIYKDNGVGTIEYIDSTGLDVALAVGPTIGVDGLKTVPSDPLILDHTAPDFFDVVLTPTGDIVANLTAGSLDIWYIETICV